jgi:hypothetical protein
MTDLPSQQTVKTFANNSGIAEVGGERCDADTLALQSEFWRLVDGRDREPQHSPGSYEATMRHENLVQQLSCNPTNGLAWADYADAEFTRNGWSVNIENTLTLSQEYAPVEGDALTLRLGLLSKLTAIEQTRSLHLFEKDIVTLINFASIPAIATVLNKLSEQSLGWAKNQMRSLPKERRSSIERELQSKMPAVH